MNKKNLLLLLFLSFLLKPVWLFDYTSLSPGDDLSYWLHSATLAFDYDIDYLNDYFYNDARFDPETNVPYHPPGSGYMSAPFVALFGMIDNFRTNNLSPYSSQIGLLSYYGFFVGTLFYTLLGFYFLSKLLDAKKLQRHKKLILLLTYLSTIVHYSTTRFLMAHAHEFFLVTLILYNFEINEKVSKKNILVLTSSYFLLSLTRPSTFLISLVLLIAYSKKINKKSWNIGNLSLLFIFSYSYNWISNYLYNSNFILINFNNSKFLQNTGYENLLDLNKIFLGLIKIPNLLFSFSGGLLWSTPIIFTGLLSFIILLKRESFNLHKLGMLFYLAGFFIVAIVWEGREVAYGQRLFIGLLPYCAYVTALISKNIDIKMLLSILNVNAYLQYLYFSSSDNLTLKEGETLWGTVVGFAPENYTVFLYKELFQLENIFTIFAKSIYAINLFSLMSLDRILQIPIIKHISLDQISKFENRADKYLDISYLYVLLTSFSFFCFLFLFIKIISSKNIIGYSRNK